MKLLNLLLLLHMVTVVQSQNVSQSSFFRFFTTVGWFLGRWSMKSYDVIKDERCRNDMMFWIDSINNYSVAFATNCSNSNDPNCEKRRLKDKKDNFFAVRQLDSFGRVPTDLLSVNMIWLGSWEECMAVRPVNLSNYRTKYCYAHVGLTFDVTFVKTKFYNLEEFQSENICSSPVLARWTVCMPRSCSEEEVLNFLSTAVKYVTNSVQICKVECYPYNPPPKDALFWIVISFFIGLVIFVIIATTVDYCTDSEEYYLRRKSSMLRCVIAFSLYSNSGEILNADRIPDQINCLHCLRACTMIWIVASHVLEMHLNGDNPLEAVKATEFFLNDIFVNAYFSVDTFLFVGGLLLAYVFFKEMDKNPKLVRSPVYWFLYYVHRYIRLSVPYFMLILFGVAIYDKVTYGPGLPNNQFNIDACKKYWWKNALYFNNFLGNKGTCMPHTWYLAADMQIHVIAPLLLVPLLFSRTIGLLFGAVLFLLTTILNYFLIIKYDFPVNYVGFFMDMYKPEKLRWFEQMLYNAPWARFSPYLIGVLTGYFLHHTKEKKLKLHWSTAVLLWCATFLILCGCIFGLYDYLQGPEFAISSFARASYHNWSKVGWGLSLAWTVVACEKNWAGPIKNLLEQTMWAPLGRLTYCAFLVHFPLIGILHSWDRRPYHYINVFHTFVRESFPIIVACYVFALLWSSIVEIPSAKLEKMAIEALFGHNADGKVHCEKRLQKSREKLFIVNGAYKNFDSQND